MKKAVIFDFDYTLGDSTEGIVKSTDYALEKLCEAKKSREEIKATVGLSLNETYKVLTGNESEDRAELFKEYFIEKANEVMVDSTELYKDTIFVLRQIPNQHNNISVIF